jgi:hypothetical protein
MRLLYQYDPSKLSEAEKERFVAALGDGFRSTDSFVQFDGVELPPEVQAGLLKHRAFLDDPAGEDGRGERTKEFWTASHSYAEEKLFQLCPLYFRYPSIREYFLEQKAAYFRHATSDVDSETMEGLKPEVTPGWRDHIYTRALNQTYSKAWYEYHINDQIFYVEQLGLYCLEEGQRGAVYASRVIPAIISFSGLLGRLVEQYYWKFLIERSAIRGEKTSRSAKSGGHVRATILKQEHVGWQSPARAVWQEHPTSPKTTVASIVKKRLKLAQSVKHISRVLTRP